MKMPVRTTTVLAMLTLAAGVNAQETPAPTPTAGYDRGFFLQSDDGDYRLRIGGRLQARYEYENVDEGAGEDREHEQAFSIPRARLKLSGHVFDPAWNYAFQADFGRGFVTLKDGYVEYRAPRVRLQVGQFKRPFSRQQITSSGDLEFVDRTLTDRAFGAGRDIGLMAHNGLGRDGFEWAAGVFNGTGDSARFRGTAEVDPATGEGTASGSFSNVPATFAPAIVGRVGYNHGGIDAYSEADLDGGPFRFAITASPMVVFDADDDGESKVAAEADYNLHVEGFSTTGGVYWMSEDERNAAAVSTIGLHVQAGYVIAGLFQPAVRFALVDPEGDDNTATELAAAFSFYFFGHSVKWANDFALLTERSPDGDTSDFRARSQLQLAF